MTARTLGFSVALITTLLAARALAVTKTWTGTDGGAFATATNWDPSGTPGAADSILFANGTVGSPYDINLFDTDATVDQLTVATNPLSLNGPGRTLSITGSTTSMLVIGRTGSGTANAVLNSSLANLNTTYAGLGDDVGNTGTLNVTAGTFNVSGTAALRDLIIGYAGTGTINVSNGADATVAGDTYLAVFGGAVGNITVFGTGSTWTSTGRVDFSKGTGTITVLSGGILSASAMSLGFGGCTLAGNGTVIAPVVNTNGTVSPLGVTSGYGTLQITGNYTQGANGKLQIQIGGTAPGSFDRLSVSGDINLAGTLQVTLPSFALPLPQNTVFDILDFTGRLGTFTTLSLPGLAGSLEWDTSKLYTDGTLRVVLPGDFNNSGVVDTADFAVWRKGLGTTYVASDYDVWRTHFGRSAAGAGSSLAPATSVPEPATLTLALLSIAVIKIFRRR